MVERIAKLAIEKNLISERTSIGLTGRAAITGCKPYLILKHIEKLGLFKEPREHIVFVDDGLARGAAVMARMHETRWGSLRTLLEE